MTELDKKAEDFVKNLRADLKDNCFLAFKKGYEEGQKDYEHLCEVMCFKRKLEKENAELKAQIEKMKNKI